MFGMLMSVMTTSTVSLLEHVEAVLAVDRLQDVEAGIGERQHQHVAHGLGIVDRQILVWSWHSHLVQQDWGYRLRPRVSRLSGRRLHVLHARAFRLGCSLRRRLRVLGLRSSQSPRSANALTNAVRRLDRSRCRRWSRIAARRSGRREASASRPPTHRCADGPTHLPAVAVIKSCRPLGRGQIEDFGQLQERVIRFAVGGWGQHLRVLRHVRSADGAALDG